MHNIYRMLGASNHCDDAREPHDFYATDPIAIDPLLRAETFSHHILEPCCGEGHLSKRLEVFGHEVLSTDLIDRGYGTSGVDFLQCTEPWHGDIVTNPPFSQAQHIVEQALDLIDTGAKLACFLRLNFLEGVGRQTFFDQHPPRTVYVFRRRVATAKNGDFTTVPRSAIAFAWFVWSKGYSGRVELDWV